MRALRLLPLLALAGLFLAATPAAGATARAGDRYLPWIGSGLFLTFAAIWATSVADYIIAR